MAGYAVMSGENPAFGRHAARAPAASSAVDARPFQRLCMGDLWVVSPGNFSDFPGHSDSMAATTTTLLELNPFVFVQ